MQENLQSLFVSEYFFHKSSEENLRDELLLDKTKYTSFNIFLQNEQNLKGTTKTTTQIFRQLIFLHLMKNSITYAKNNS